MNDSLATKKSAFEKPENYVAWAGLAVMGWVGINLLDRILPLITRVLENVIYTGILAGVIAIGGFLLVNGDFHRLVGLLYMNGMRKLTGLVIELDPIGAMKTYLGQLQNDQKKLKIALESMRGQAEKLQSKLDRQGSNQEHSLKLMSQAKARSGERGMAMEARRQGRKATRAQELVITLQGLLNKIRTFIAIMEKVEEATEYMMLDISDTIEVESEKRETIQEAWKAMNAAKRILAKNKQREMFDMALESTRNDYEFKVGEIKQFMKDTESFIATMDLEQGVADGDALQMLEDWEQRSLALLEGGTGKTKYRVAPVGVGSSTRMLASSTGAEVIDAELVEEGDRPSFANLFDKLDKN